MLKGILVILIRGGTIILKKRFLIMLSLFSIFITSCSIFPDSQNNDPEAPDEETGNIDDSVKEPQTDSDDLPEESEEDEQTVVSFYGVGDNLIHEQIFDYAQVDDTFDFKPIYKNIEDQISTADLSFINQESIIGGDELGFSGYPAFNTPSAMTKDLVDLGFDIVGGSNNHTLDKGTQGVLNTINYWADYADDILFTGAFDSQEHRDTIPIVEVNGLKFSVLTYTYGTNGLVPEHSYLVNYFDPDLITDDVKRAQELSDFVIVSAHWGDEHVFSPNQMQFDYAQLFADLEVDLVVGTHSHTIQPLEWVTGKHGNETLVIYSLGNLVASTTSDFNLLGGSVSLNFVADEEEFSIEEVVFEPHVIHYELGTPGEISSRTNFEIYPLADYTDELAAQHALVDFEDNIISVENYMEIVDDVIDEDFLE